MGPLKFNGPGGYFHLPTLKPDGYKLQWLEEVRLWDEMIEATSKSGDSNVKGTTATLIMNLYRSLDQNKIN